MKRENFRIMQKAGMFIIESPVKEYRAFPTMTLAGQWIDSEVARANGYRRKRGNE